MSDIRELEELKRVNNLELQAKKTNPLVTARDDQEYDDFEETNIDSELRKDIEAVLNVIVRPKLAEDGGDLEITYLDDEGTLWIQMLGQCHGCPSANDTVKGLVEKELVPRIPQIKKVDIDSGLSEDFIRDVLDQMLSYRNK